MLKKLFFILIFWLWIFPLPQLAWANHKTLHHHTHTTARKTKKKHHIHKKPIAHKHPISTKTKQKHAHSKKNLHTASHHSSPTHSEINHSKTNHSKLNHDNINQQKLTATKVLPTPEASHMTPMASEKLMAWVSKTVSKLRYSHYKYGGSYFNPAHGVYEVDCSGYVNNLLVQAAPDAYHNVLHFTRTYKPTSEDYYHFFKDLPKGRPRNDWYQVPKVSQLNSGDILVFRYSHHFWKHSNGGHVMVVVHSPVPLHWYDNSYLVRVADSASAGHSNDTRPPHTSGIGIGTLIIKVNRFSGRTCAFAWKVGSRWKHVELAMARPIYA